MEIFLKNKRNSIFIALICMLLWGSAFPVLKMSYSEMNIATNDYLAKIYFAGIRFFCAGILVILYYLLFSRGKKGKIDLPFLLKLGVIQTTIQYFFFYIGVGNTSGVKSSILQSISTFFIVLLSHFAFKNDPLNHRKILALIFGFGGIFIANLTHFDWSFTFTGEGFLIFSGLANAIGTILVKDKGREMNPFIMTLGQMLFGSILLILPGRFLMEGQLQWTPFALFLLLYSAFISATAFSLWYELLKYHKSGEISVYQLFIPIFGSLLSLLLLPGENLSYNLLAGLILVCFGIWILNRKGKDEKIKNR